MCDGSGVPFVPEVVEGAWDVTGCVDLGAECSEFGFGIGIGAVHGAAGLVTGAGDRMTSVADAYPILVGSELLD